MQHTCACCSDNYPMRMHKGKVIDSVVIIGTVVDIVVDTKIAKSEDLGT